MGGDDLTFLSTLPYFQGLTRTELAQVHGHCRQRDLAPGETIVHEGHPADSLYVVRRGRVRIYTVSEEGKEQVLFVRGPGTTFNDEAVFDRGPALATAEAFAPGTCVYVVPASLMTHLLAVNPRVAANVVRELPRRVRQLTTLVDDLSFHHIIQRVARLLLEENAATGQITLTKQEMAARVGTVREAVSRTLHQLEDSGAITRQHNRTVQVNVPMLSALLGTVPHTPERSVRTWSVAGTGREHQEVMTMAVG
jgi:CRP/FNR family transcriptional regulator, cyclic AMP receptor protein